MSSAVWLRVATTADLDAAGVLGVVAGGHGIALCRVLEGVFAVADLCPDDGTRLSRGTRQGERLLCPVGHGFDIRTGVAFGRPQAKALRCYPTKVEEDAIFVCTEE